MNLISQTDKNNNDAGLDSLLDPLFERIYLSDPELARAILRCTVPRWFDKEVMIGMCSDESPCPAANDEVYSRMLSLNICIPHPTRDQTWEFRASFRNYCLRRPEVIQQWQELHTRAAETFKRMLDVRSLNGAKRFQDEEWRLLASEWLYHLLQTTIDAGLEALKRICAEALAIPVYQGPSWEIDFCVQLLANLEWPVDIERMNTEIQQLKQGFEHLARGRDIEALPMVKQLAATPGLTPKQVGELHYFAGVTHLYDEGKLGPAWEELEQAVQLLPEQAKVHAAIAALHSSPGIGWGRLDLAAESAEEAIRMEPHQAEGYVAIGRVFELQESWKQAVAYYQRAIEVEPDDIEGYLALSGIYARLRKAKEAFDLIDKVWKISPFWGYYASIRKGNLLTDMRDFECARLEYEKAIASAPDQAAPYLALGQFYEQIDEPLKSEELYKRVIETVDPMAEEAYIALAGLYQSQGKLWKAIKVCRDSLERGIAGKRPYITLIDLLRQQENISEMVEIEEKLATLDWAERYASYCRIGDAWLDKVRNHPGSLERPSWLAQAKTEFEKAIELDKHRAWAYLSMAELSILRREFDQLDEIEQKVMTYTPWAQYDLLVRSGQACLTVRASSEAARLLNRAIELAPHRLSGWLALSDLYTWQGDPAHVARVWEEIVRIDPALRYRAYIDYGYACESVEDYMQAREAYTAAIELEPATGLAYLRLGIVQEAEGDLEKAIQSYQTAAEKTSGLAPIALAALAKVLRSQRKLTEAERTLRRAIALDLERLEAITELACLGAACDQPHLVAEASEQVISASPVQQYDFYIAVGDAYFAAHRFDEARHFFNRCLALNAERADAYIKIAELLFEQGMRSEAYKEVERAIALEPDEVAGYIALGRFCASEQKLDGVISAWQRIVELEPGLQYDAFLEIGGVLEQIGQVEQAVQQYREALRLCPWRRNAYIALSLLLMQLENPEDSEELTEMLQQAKAEVGLSYLELGYWAEQQGKPDDALKIYLLGKRHDPIEIQPFLSLQIGSLYETREQFEKAQFEYEQAIALAPNRAEGYLQLGQLLLNLGQLDEALDVCRRMAEQPELAYNAYISLGNLLLAKQAYTEAQNAYRQAIALAPNRRDAYLQLGQLLLGQGQPDEAAQLYRQMARQPELGATAHVLLGDLWTSQERLKEAEKAYRQAVRLDRRQPIGYLRMAELFLRQGDLHQAESWVKKAMQVAPDAVDPYILLAQLKEQQGNISAAIDLYRQIAQRRPEEASAAHERIGDLLIQLERYPEAIHVLQDALRENPNNAGASFSLGVAYERQDDLEQAAAMYSQTIDIAPSYLDAYSALAHIYAKQKAVAQIAELADQLLSQSLEPTERYNAHMIIGLAYQEAQGLIWALEEFRAAQKIDPARTEAYLARGQTYEMQERWEDARTSYLELYELAPEWRPAIHRKLGDLYYLEKEYDKAEEEYQKTVALTPEQLEGYYGLAWVYLAQEQYAKAARPLEQIIGLKDLDPVDRANAYLFLADVLRKLGDSRGMFNACSEAIVLTNNVDSLNPDLLRLKGLALFMQDNYHEAMRSLQGCLEMNPADAKAYFYLALTQLCLGNRTEALQLLEDGLASVSDGSEFSSPIREAEALVERSPAIEGVNEFLERLKKAADEFFCI